jgi:prepilin-type processing-associated H-X9-DG protein/prepilin-type N-terminal cleavage/methylation domain-containing protein
MIDIRGRVPRAAFTLVELLVVIAIIAILVLLLLPAVNAAREAARNTQCKNNIRQLALAMINYEAAHGHFPASESASGRDRRSGGCEPGFYSWQSRILPYIEEDQLYSRIDFTVDMADQCNEGLSGQISDTHRNALAAATPIEAFLCPSDAHAAPPSSLMGSALTAPDSYAGNAGWPALATGFHGERATPAKYNGLISVVNQRVDNDWQPKSPVRARHVKDGLSKTAAVAERLIQRGSTREQILGGPEQTKSYHITEQPRTLEAMVERCSPASTHADLEYSAYLGQAWISGWAPTGATYMHVKPPNTNHCHFSHSITTGDFVVTPSSKHAGGVNVAYADGHVEFIADDVDMQIWWAMGSRNGGESGQTQ